jgi:hypothetical protein
LLECPFTPPAENARTGALTATRPGAESEFIAAGIHHRLARSLVESSNKLMKDASAEDLGNSTMRSGRGFAFNHLATALAVVSPNLRRLRAFFVKEAVRSGS